MAGGKGQSEARRVVDEFIGLFNRAISGENIDPFIMVSDDLEYTITGQTPLSITVCGPDELKRKIFSHVVGIANRKPGFGLYPYEYIEEDNKLVVLMRGRGEHQRGVPYNNDYFFLFEVENGRIVRMIEDVDAVHIMLSLFNMHFEETVHDLPRRQTTSG